MLSYSVGGEPWFRGKYVATIVEDADIKKAISYNVSEDDQQQMEELGKCFPP